MRNSSCSSAVQRPAFVMASRLSASRRSLHETAFTTSCSSLFLGRLRARMRSTSCAWQGRALCAFCLARRLLVPTRAWRGPRPVRRGALLALLLPPHAWRGPSCSAGVLAKCWALMWATSSSHLARAACRSSRVSRSASSVAGRDRGELPLHASTWASKVSADVVDDRRVVRAADVDER